jgi:hypothetical protein
MDIHPWIPMDVHGYPWIGQMIPTGFGYGYSQSGIPSYSQPKEGGDFQSDTVPAVRKDETLTRMLRFWARKLGSELTPNGIIWLQINF